ncbi:hypothetical protein GOP47_0018700 [Adiantum capillus-veneris]|uniref:Uncharacterized protein n=1 Tax=Adiantum capillus-veneris TaxID=13818 RepID=A0A9D4UF52_ADICA|nr:hypothetical protein GOP47_0018700 [Adiantum capillus-veneris]
MSMHCVDAGRAGSNIDETGNEARKGRQGVCPVGRRAVGKLKKVRLCRVQAYAICELNLLSNYETVE